MIDVYEYREEARRPLIWAAAVVSGFLLGVMVWQAAPWFIWLTWGGASVALFVHLARNPVTGIRLTPDDLTLSPWRMPEVIALKDVRLVRIVDWTDGTDMEIHLHNGTATRIQQCDMPPRGDFIEALAKRGVPVEIA